jgi:bifunctional UDP-N-acetylglucosamine pyrophosphorylase/glucosamine-1-phosphate N-acetyltransferase
VGYNLRVKGPAAGLSGRADPVDGRRRAALKRKKEITAVVLAAGEGTRMKSSLPKVLHPVCGRPMLLVVLDALRELRPRRILVVAGNGADLVREAVGDTAEVVVQEKRLGTGHAVLTAEPHLEPNDENLLVLAGDTPLITPSTLQELSGLFFESGAEAAMLTLRLPDPSGYGRVLRGQGGEVQAVVEEKDASEEVKAVDEVNASVYVFRRPDLFSCLREVDNRNRKGEYYLTDVVGKLRERGGRVVALRAGDAAEGLGVNTRAELAEAERQMRLRVNRRLMEEGVGITDPTVTYIDLGVEVGRETVIFPFTFLQGSTRVGENCRIGPGARIVDSTLGDGVVVQESVVRESVLEDGCNVGPYASLRPGTRLGKQAKAGTFVEMKNSSVGRGSKVPHLSYMGDADIGEGVNVGAGSITCNYDGEKKHPTVIEDGAFIGSDTMFIAPVRIGRGAVTGAGSAISKDVPPGALGVERAPQKIIEGWKKRKPSDTRRLRKLPPGGKLPSGEKQPSADKLPPAGKAPRDGR